MNLELKTHLKRCREIGWVSPEGIIYHEELAGASGMDFRLYPAPHHTKKDIEKTTNWLLVNRDVVHIDVARVTKEEYPIEREWGELTPQERETGFREIVKTGTAMPMENFVLVDQYTASIVVQLMDNLKPANKEKYLKYTCSTMIDLAYQFMERK